MDKQTLIRDMKQFIGGGGFINVSQIAKYLKRSRDCVSTLVEGLDYLVTGREKKYFIPDIASRIMEYGISKRPVLRTCFLKNGLL